MTEDGITVSIVIVCMNRTDNLYPCLESIRKFNSVNCEILVVAYLFDRKKLAQAREDFPEVRFIDSRQTRGFSENNNLALRQARGRYCFILNDDTLFTCDALKSLVEDMEALPRDAAIVSPKLLNSDMSLQLCGRPDYPWYNYLLQQWHLYSEKKDDTAGKRPVLGSVYSTVNICGAAFLIKTEVFRELGWFDERYFFTPEDIALSTLARSRGYGVYVDSAVSIIHKARTTASALSSAVRPAAVKGSLIFFASGRKTRGFFLKLGVWLAESSKRLKAYWTAKVHPSPENRIKHQTFKNISRSIFSSLSPKELFIKYSKELSGNGS